MGEMFRRYWIPALLAEELPENDGAPVRVHLLSERLIAFRDSMGRFGLIDEFCARFVYFYSGYLFADLVFALSDRARARPAWALAGLVVWALVNGGLVVSGFSESPLISLALGLAGACAIIIFGTLLARAHLLDFLRLCGEHSIVIYLGFFLPMAATRTLLLRTGLIHDIGTISLVVTIAGVVGALVLWRMARAVHADFLFERPATFWIAPKKQRATLQAAE